MKINLSLNHSRLDRMRGGKSSGGSGDSGGGYARGGGDDMSDMRPASRGRRKSSKRGAGRRPAATKKHPKEMDFKKVFGTKKKRKPRNQSGFEQGI